MNEILTCVGWFAEIASLLKPGIFFVYCSKAWHVIYIKQFLNPPSLPFPPFLQQLDCEGLGLNVNLSLFGLLAGAVIYLKYLPWQGQTLTAVEELQQWARPRHGLSLHTHIPASGLATFLNSSLTKGSAPSSPSCPPTWSIVKRWCLKLWQSSSFPWQRALKQIWLTCSIKLKKQPAVGGNSC